MKKLICILMLIIFSVATLACGEGGPSGKLDRILCSYDLSYDGEDEAYLEIYLSQMTQSGVTPSQEFLANGTITAHKYTGENGDTVFVVEYESIELIKELIGEASYNTYLEHGYCYDRYHISADVQDSDTRDAIYEMIAELN